MASHYDNGVNSKKSTRLVNDTHVKLHLYYVSSNGNPYFRKTLYPRPSDNNDASVDVSTDTRVTTVNDGEELRDGHTFIEEFDSNNTFGMLRLWDEKRPVVALDTDQLIDNREITITITDDGNFMPIFTGRLWNEKFSIVALDMDELIDNQEITITISDDGNFTPKFTGRLWNEKCPMVALDMDELIDNQEITIANLDDVNFTPKFNGRSQEKQPKDAQFFPGESSARPGPTPSGNFNFFVKVKQYASNKFSSFRPTRPNDG